MTNPLITEAVSKYLAEGGKSLSQIAKDASQLTKKIRESIKNYRRIRDRTAQNPNSDLHSGDNEYYAVEYLDSVANYTAAFCSDILLYLEKNPDHRDASLQSIGSTEVGREGYRLFVEVCNFSIMVVNSLGEKVAPERHKRKINKLARQSEFAYDYFQAVMDELLMISHKLKKSRSRDMDKIIHGCQITYAIAATVRSTLDGLW